MAALNGVLALCWVRIKTVLTSPDRDGFLKTRITYGSVLQIYVVT